MQTPPILFSSFFRHQHCVEINPTSPNSAHQKMQIEEHNLPRSSACELPSSLQRARCTSTIHHQCRSMGVHITLSASRYPSRPRAAVLRSVNGLRTETQMANGDATTLLGIVLEVGLRNKSKRPNGHGMFHWLLSARKVV